MTLPLHGETVTALSWYPITRGHYKEYRCAFQIENPSGGQPIINGATFDESVAKTFRKAGYDVNHSITHKSFPLPNVDIVIEDINNRYRIVAIYAADGTLHNVPEKERGTTSSRTPNKDVLKRQYTDPSTLARLEKKANEEAAQPEPPNIPKADSPIFAHGSEMIREHLTVLRAEKETPVIHTLRLGHWLRGVA